MTEEGENTSENDDKLKEYTWEEIREHDNEESLWIVMYGRVYDVTEFQVDHPGGPDVLEHIAGQDGTEEFENILHTKKARLMAKKWLIGKVKGETLGNLFDDTTQSSTNTNNTNDSFLQQYGVVVAAVVVIAVLLAIYQFYQ